ELVGAGEGSVETLVDRTATVGAPRVYHDRATGCRKARLRSYTRASPDRFRYRWSRNTASRRHVDPTGQRVGRVPKGRVTGDESTHRSRVGRCTGLHHGRSPGRRTANAVGDTPDLRDGRR